MTLFPLISTEDLAVLLGDPSLRLLDGSWHLDGRDGRAEFAAERLPGARFFDLEAVSDPDSDLPHMLPTPESFATSLGELGVSADDRIVVYDAAGLFSAARVWWMLKTMGARRVQVLDGGLPKWKAEGRPVETGPAASFAPAAFTTRFNADAVISLDELRAVLDAGGQVVDARGVARFSGQAADPRPGVRPGHMPGAVNLPYGTLLEADGTLKKETDLSSAFAEAGVDITRPIITSCGSGVTAAILSLGLETLRRSSRLYDGSWSEWGRRVDTVAVVDN